MFSCGFCEISKNIFSYRATPVAASDILENLQKNASFGVFFLLKLEDIWKMGHIINTFQEILQILATTIYQKHLVIAISIRFKKHYMQHSVNYGHNKTNRIKNRSCSEIGKEKSLLDF